MDAKVMLAVDAMRKRLTPPYDPVRGIGCYGVRRMCATPVPGLAKALVPESMTADAEYLRVMHDPDGWRRLRCRHDFEYWCVECVKIKHKTLGTAVPFVLNRPQRRVLSVLEDDRLAGRPIRIILLKARQWGGSTLVQMYMAWIQCCHRRSWYSLICAHLKDTSASIRGMYSRLLEFYPPELWEGDSEPCFKAYEGSQNMRMIAGRDCVVTLASAERPDSVRGGDYAMAHLSEMAYWADTPSRQPDDVIRAVCGGVALVPYSLVAVESTANGVGNYFHSEWLRCRSGEGDKHAVFVPWFEIDIYRLEPPDAAAFAESLSPGEMRLWETGLTLDRLYWGRRKRAEYATDQQMQAEYPADDSEAFVTTGAGVFDPADIEALRDGCEAPSFRGELCGGKPVADPSGCLKIWRAPAEKMRYVVAADIGGTRAASNWSVASVLAFPEGGVPEVAAQWRGHVPHDCLVRILADLARYYNLALLVVESNTLESRDALMEDSAEFIVNRLARCYGNLYRRESFDTVTGERSTRIGFHTNRSTKAMLIINLQGLVRERAYIERDNDACNELATYEHCPGGAYGARRGFHDDILMSRAIGLFVGSSRRLSAAGILPSPRRW